MMLSSTILCALLSIPGQVAAAGSPDAQNAPSAVKGVRKRMLGRIVQADGSAWAGAQVRLIAWPDWNYPGIGEFDDLRAVTDERGRFNAKGLQHRRYYVWAWQADEGSVYRISEAGRFVAPGKPLVLKEAGRRVRKRMIEVDLEAWSRLGPFRIALREDPFVGPYSSGVSRQLDMLAWIPTDFAVDKKFELPVLPWPQVRVELLGEGGMLLYQRSIPLVDEGVGIMHLQIIPEKGRQHGARFYLDERNTKQAKGYKLYQRYLGRMIEMDSVDADGQGRILLPDQARSVHYRLWLERGPWYVGRLEGRAQGADYNLTRSTRIGGGRGLRVRGVLAVLGESHPLQLEVRGPGGEPLAGLPILIWQRERSASFVRMVYVLPVTMGTTDAQGRLSWPWLSKQEYAIFAILPDEVLDQLMQDSKVPIHPMVLLRRGLGIDVESDKRDVISVAELQDVEFDASWDKEKVRDAPHVNIFTPIADSYGYARLLRTSCDLRGRARVLLPPAQQLPYLVHSLLGVATGTVTTRTAADVSKALKLAMRIPHAIEIAGTVADKQGRPVPQASLALGNPWFRMRGQHPLLRFDVSRISVLTDEQGRFRIFQEEVKAPLQLYVTGPRGARLVQRSVHTLNPTDPLTGLQIEIVGLRGAGGNKPGVPGPKVRRVPVNKQ